MPLSHLKEMQRILRICLKGTMKTFLVLVEDTETENIRVLNVWFKILSWEDANGESLLCEDFLNSCWKTASWGLCTIIFLCAWNVKDNVLRCGRLSCNNVSLLYDIHANEVIKNKWLEFLKYEFYATLDRCEN